MIFSCTFPWPYLSGSIFISDLYSLCVGFSLHFFSISIVLVCIPIQERSAMQRDHTGELEKVVTDYEKIKINAIRTFERAVKRCG